jgi:hypothetical protein
MSLAELQQYAATQTTATARATSAADAPGFAAAIPASRASHQVRQKRHE